MSTINLKNIQKSDPVKRLVEKESGKEEFSPMDPPDAFNPPTIEEVPYNDLHPFLQSFIDEHKNFEKQLSEFENEINLIYNEGVSKDKISALSSFFEFFDSHILVHNQKEDKFLFPYLKKKLLSIGEHSNGKIHTTPVDILEENHVKIMQLITLSFNLLGMATRLPDASSRMIVLDTALEKAKELVEDLKLHIFREDNILLPLAHKHFTKNELNELEQEYTFVQSHYQ